MHFIKRKSTLLVSFILAIVLCFSFSIGAEEISTPEEVISPSTEEAPAENPIVNDTLFARIFEWVEANNVSVLSAAELGAMALFAYWSKNKNKIMVSGLVKAVNGQSDVVASSASMEKASNKILDMQENFARRLEAIEASEKDREKVSQANLYVMTKLVQLQNMLTLNNSNIPQAIKNYSTAVCADCLSALNNEEAVKNAYAEMREIIGIKDEDEDSKNEKKKNT